MKDVKDFLNRVASEILKESGMSEINIHIDNEHCEITSKDKIDVDIKRLTSGNLMTLVGLMCLCDMFKVEPQLTYNLIDNYSDTIDMIKKRARQKYELED